MPGGATRNGTVLRMHASATSGVERPVKFSSILPSCLGPVRPQTLRMADGTVLNDRAATSATHKCRATSCQRRQVADPVASSRGTPGPNRDTYCYSLAGTAPYRGSLPTSEPDARVLDAVAMHSHPACRTAR